MGRKINELSEDRFVCMLMLFTSLYGKRGEHGCLLLKLNRDLTERLAASIGCGEDNLLLTIKRFETKGTLKYENQLLSFNPDKFIPAAAETRYKVAH